MHYVKPTLTALILVSSLLYSTAAALAQEVPAAAEQPRKAAPAKPAARPAPKAPARPVKRRAVQQVIGSINDIAPVTDGYRPTLYPRPLANSPTPPIGTPMAPPLPARTATINSCDGGGCTDTGGTRYNSGVGNAALSADGRLCHGSGTTVQCF